MVKHVATHSQRAFRLNVRRLEEKSATDAERTRQTEKDDGPHIKREGAITRRLSQMTDESLESGGKAARKAIEDAGFSEELKKRLEAKIIDSQFRNENASALSQASLSQNAGKETRDTAASQSWTGTETIEDASLRMLNDAYKPLRGTSRSSSSSGSASTAAASKAATANLGLDARMRKAVQRASQGERLARARDRTSIYAISQDPTLTEAEKESMRKQLKERFSPGARPMPATVQGLAALANERIEDAIARGQFKNIARGTKANVERDHNASSPFLDTTEYFMNKIIQKQEIVPPWIEKQQEVVKQAEVFRARLRREWRRHASRVIASKGGTVEDMVRRAEVYAEAEARVNPRRGRKESLLSEIDEEGRLAQVTIEEVPEGKRPADVDSTIITGDGSPVTTDSKHSDDPLSTTDPKHSDDPLSTSSASASPPASPPPLPSPTQLPSPPFRDPAWESLENPYHTLSIQSLNSLTRSYNLLAPRLAQKPYFSLPRELAACYADVAPQLASEIRERGRRSKGRMGEDDGDGDGQAGGRRDRGGGMLRRFGGGGGVKEEVKVWDDRRKSYGLREFLRDLVS